MASRIEDYALVGDLHTGALIGRDGSIDWLCLPRFDSPACFAALLADQDAGHWRLVPEGARTTTTTTSRRRYLGDTLILQTDWDTGDGTVRVTDFMPPRGEAADIVRIVEGITGTVTMQTRLRLRFDYGSIDPWVRHGERDHAAIAGPDAVWLHSDVPVDHHERSIEGDFTVAAGQQISFVLTHQLSHLPRPQPAHSQHALAATEAFWQDWINHCTYTGDYTDAVHRSLILLKALTYAPTGGIVAAATTSLPEQIGGPRNWDYRYCWLRDATFTLQALLGTGYVAEAKAWREWLLRAVAGDPADLQIMYSLDGTRRLTESSIDWLPGYEGSGPVRVGNAAAQQFQLDVWGEVLDGLHLARDAGIAATTSGWDLQKALLDFLESNWREPDNGLWEVRGPRRQFVHSKVMAWAGLDRAVTAVERHGLDGPVDRWRATREQIHADVCAHGYDPDRNTFTQFYGSRGLDAALLLIPRVGFLPYDDPRVVGTIDAIQKQLCTDGFLLRYQPQHDDNVDGLPGTEGAFLACTFWLADALHGTGRTRQARDLFERLLELRNDVGMLSEEYDPGARRQLGNTPQAFSLVALLNTARHLSGSSTRTSDSPGQQHTDTTSPHR
jgi:GH15 family glucan-1,4-alpha-glucosidase